MKRTLLHRRHTLTVACLIVCLIAGIGSAPGQQAASVDDDLAILSPFIGETAAVVFRVDPGRLATPELAEVLQKSAPGSGEAPAAS